MYLQIVCSFLVLLALVFLRKCWIVPRQNLLFYQRQLQKSNFKYKIVPYHPLYNASFDEFKKEEAKGDPERIYKEEYPKYDVVITNVFNQTLVELCSAEFIKDFFDVENNYNFQKLKPVIRVFYRFFGMSLGMYEGQEWKKRRSILNQIFNFDFIKMQTSNIVAICDQQLIEIQSKNQIKLDEDGSKYIQIHLYQDLMLKLFSGVILTSFLGIKKKEFIDGIEASQYVTEIANDMIQYQLSSPTLILGDWFYNAEFRKIDKSINAREASLKKWGKKLVQQKIKQIQQQYEQKNGKIKIDDLVKAFVVYRNQNILTKGATNSSDQQIFSQFLGFFMAGTDTTSNYLNMIICNLARYPQVQKQVRKEVDAFMKQDDYSFENLKNFKYIEAVQKETTRTYGPATSLLLREAVKDTFINGLAIKKGTLVNTMISATHNCQKYYKQPHKFRPERWLNGECDNLSTYALMGFGGGARTCIGKHLALLESKIALIKILKRYKKITIPNRDFKMRFKFMQCPEQFKIKLTLN